MTAAEKINFVNENQSAEYFEKDADLYRKIYPASRLLPELSRANQYNKVHLDGRMLLEILDVVCGETVLENRGIVKGINTPPGPDPAILLNTFKKVDLANTPYQDQKKWLKDLGITTADQKGATILAALQQKQEELKNSDTAKAGSGEQGSPDPDEPGQADGETETNVGKDAEGAPPDVPAGDDVTEKKSGDPE